MKLSYLIKFIWATGLIISTLASCQTSEHESISNDTTQHKTTTKAVPKIDYEVKLDSIASDLPNKQVKAMFSITPKDSAKVAVTDIGGVVIRAEAISGKKTNHTLKLPNLRPGIYLVSVIAPSGQKASKELMWQ